MENLGEGDIVSAICFNDQVKILTTDTAPISPPRQTKPQPITYSPARSSQFQYQPAPKVEKSECCRIL